MPLFKGNTKPNRKSKMEQEKNINIKIIANEYIPYCPKCSKKEILVKKITHDFNKNILGIESVCLNCGNEFIGYALLSRGYN